MAEIKGVGKHRGLALLCLAGLLWLSVVHSGHFRPPDLLVGGAELHASADGDSFCPACIAIHSSLAELSFCAAPVMFVGQTRFIATYYNLLAQQSRFGLFVRPPPSI